MTGRLDLAVLAPAEGPVFQPWAAGFLRLAETAHARAERRGGRVTRLLGTALLLDTGGWTWMRASFEHALGPVEPKDAAMARLTTLLAGGGWTFVDGGAA